uniref:Uncharacterized protein n=1 Tax=Ficedula albicollis TaxID=59894 RepID=A0A803V2Y3_FICAL
WAGTSSLQILSGWGTILLCPAPGRKFRCSPLLWHCTCGHEVNWISLLFQLKPNRLFLFFFLQG